MMIFFITLQAITILHERVFILQIQYIIIIIIIKTTL